MARLTPEHASDRFGSIPLAIGLFITVSALVALCAKHARRVSTKYLNKTNDSGVAPRSPLRSPKQFRTTISNKAILFIHQKKTPEEADADSREDGLWQKTILMGEKCQPPEFSGVIYYDCCGNQISELPPRSPRASPLPSFSFPVPKVAN